MTIFHFDSAKEAHAAGYSVYISSTPCKHNHEDRKRKVHVNEKNQVTSRCIACRNHAIDKNLIASKDSGKRQASLKAWKERNKHNANRWRERLRDTKPFNQQLASVRTRCLRNQIKFDLDEEYLESIMPSDGKCPILGVQMIHGIKGTDKKTWISIDRIDPSKGYIKGNVALISLYANSLKRDCADSQVFRRLAAYIEQGLQSQII